MISQGKKKIYLIGTNPSDILDCTIHAIKTVQNSESIIVSKKIGKNFLKLINNKNIYFQEDLSKKNDVTLWLEIIKLFKYHNTISQLFNGDPNIDSSGSEQQDFFKKNDIECEIISGVIKVINYMNINSNLLTDREKNFSSSFLKKFDRDKIFEIVSNLYFEKLVILIQNKNELKQICLFLEDLSFKKKLTLSLFSDGKIKKSIKSYTKIIENYDTPAYIIIENNEKI